MISILFFIFAVGLYLYPLPELTPITASALAIGMFFTAISIIFYQQMIYSTATTALQKAEQNLNPRIIELYTHDVQIKYLGILPIIFILISLASVIDILFFNFAHRVILFPVWVLFLGLSIEILNYLYRRIYSFLSPFSAIDLYAVRSEAAIRGGKDRDFCHWIDIISETSLKALSRNSASITQHALDVMQRLFRDYLEASKSLTHRAEATDTVSYSLFFYFQRLELIFDQALQRRLETVCSDIITSLGKVTFYAAKYDISMATYPIHYIGKFAKKAQANEMPDVANRAILTLIEVSKILLQDIDVTYAELQDPFFSIINNIQDLAKESFRMDKKINIKLLTQPFLDLKELFKSEKMAKHPDTGPILEQIDRALEEFQMLDEVLRTLPPFPEAPNP